MTRRVFVANRGEIAVRVIDASDRLGLETVLGVSVADRETLAARRAGRVIVLGGPRSADSYLRAETVVQAAVSTGCTVLHPGYGFLSEEPSFARLCADQGLTFVGPGPDALETLGDKLAARRLAESVGVPVGPGGTAKSLDEVTAIADSIGYPVLVKAAHGGGGRGMNLAADRTALLDAWGVASAEAEAAFGDGTVFLERSVRDAKHVEVQVLADRHGHHVHLGERECSVQLHYQKVVEEAPCSVLPEPTRELLHDSALRVIEAIDYVGLATVEFLYDVAADRFSFLEVNPRVQVEHPVTEAISGVDLVREQILVALGEPLSFEQSEVRLTGHAIEARITASSPGVITRWRPPVRGSLRLDSHIYEGYSFPPLYDALMGKLMAWGRERDQALELMAEALADFQIEGIATSLDQLARVVDHPDFRNNTVTTHWLGDMVKEDS